MYFKKELKKNRGFSLVELMVVIGIMAVISGVSIFNYGKFSSSLVVTNLAYQAALAVREAQVYGISVKQSDVGNFNSSYGVWFDSGNLTKFYLFSDKSLGSNKNIFDGGVPPDGTDGLEEGLSLGSLGGSNKIKKFCVIKDDTVFYCSGDGSGLTYMSIMFKRPNPDAFIYGFNSSNGSIDASVLNFSSAEIQFESSKGDKVARMTVTNTGQISIDTCNGKEGTPRACK